MMISHLSISGLKPPIDRQSSKITNQQQSLADMCNTRDNFSGNGIHLTSDTVVISHRYLSDVLAIGVRIDLSELLNRE